MATSLLRAALPFLAATALSAQESAAALFEKARAAQVSGRSADAEAGYRAYLRTFPPSAEVLANLGVLLAGRENYQEAIGYYQKALKLDPSLAALHLNLGLAYLKQGQGSPAAAAFERYLKTAPGDRKTKQLLAMALLESERYADAERRYRELLPSDDITILLGLGTALIRQRKAAEARELLEPMLATNQSPEMLLASGQLLFQEDRMDEALAVLEKARALRPGLPRLRLTIGSVYWRRRETDRAITEWRAEYTDHPGSFEAVYTLGAALALRESEWTEAEKLLRLAVAARPGNARANYQLARLIWKRGKNPEALRFVKSATRTDPTFREAAFLEGNILRALGRKAEADQAFQKAKQLFRQDLERQRDLFTESQ